MITILPAIGWLLSAIPMKFYNFIGAERVLAHKELQEMRAQKAALAAKDDIPCGQ
jgi:Na+/melibiose symporter-like transporter